MISIQVLSLIVSGVVGGIIVVGASILKKKGITPEEISEDVQKVAVASNAVINVAEAIIPNSPVVPILNIIKEWGPIAAGFAQQLCHAGDITKDERIAYAEEVVYSALKVSKLDIDDDKKLLIEAAIKDVVNSFGHKDKSEAEKEAEKQQLLHQNTQLKQTIDQIKSTVGVSNIATASTNQATVQVQ